MELAKDVIYLSDFTPLIQLWAGICLLFFYEKFLKDSPFNSSVAETKQLYEDFVARYQVYVIDRLPQFESYLKINWDDFVLTIKNMAALSFFYSLLVLAFIVIEDKTIFPNLYLFFQFSNIAIVIFMLIAIFNTHSKLFHTYWTPIIYFFVILIFFFSFPSINDLLIACNHSVGEFLSRTAISVTTFITCFIGLLFILIHLIVDFVILNQRKKRIETISNNFSYFVEATINVSNMKNIPQELKLKLSKRIVNDFFENGELSFDRFNEYFIDEIKEELASINTPWYKSPHLKRFCRGLVLLVMTVLLSLMLFLFFKSVIINI